MGAADPRQQAVRRLVIVPAFNEGASVRRVVTRLRRALPGYDVVVIDDGSTDDTVRQVPPWATVINLPFNLGIGGAMQTGYRYAALHGYDVAVQVDGDGQHRPAEVRRLVRELEQSGSDLVVGSRFMRAERENRSRYRQTFVRLTGAWVLRALLRHMTGLAVTDCTSGFRAANRRVIRAFAHWYPEDYPEPEVILLLHRAGYRISELPVRMRRRRGGRSSINVLDGLFYVLKVSICLILDLAREPWPRGKVVEEARSGDAEADPAAVSVAGPVARPGPGIAQLAGPTSFTPVPKPSMARNEPLPQPVSGGLRWDPAAAGHSPASRI